MTLIYSSSLIIYSTIILSFGHLANTFWGNDDGTHYKTQNDLGEFMFGAPTYSFHVDPTVDTKELQLNVDLTVAMPCHCE
jgi:hypothetical protein